MKIKNCYDLSLLLNWFDINWRVLPYVIHYPVAGKSLVFWCSNRFWQVLSEQKMQFEVFFIYFVPYAKQFLLMSYHRRRSHWVGKAPAFPESRNWRLEEVDLSIRFWKNLPHYKKRLNQQVFFRKRLKILPSLATIAIANCKPCVHYIKQPYKKRINEYTSVISFYFSLIQTGRKKKVHTCTHKKERFLGNKNIFF